MKNLRKYLGGLCAVAGLLSSQAARADVICEFSISQLFSEPSGWVTGTFVSPAGVTRGWWICPVNASVSVNDGNSVFSLTSESCRAIYSALLTARASNRPIYFGFKNAANCLEAALPGNLNPAPAGSVANYPTHIFF